MTYVAKYEAICALGSSSADPPQCKKTKSVQVHVKVCKMVSL